MSGLRVLVCGRLPEGGRRAFEEAGIAATHLPDREAGSLADVIEPFHGVIVHSPHLVDAATLEAGRSLRVVGRAGVGVDNIDVDAATARGVLVMNLPWGNTVTAAEHTMAMMLALARNIPQASAALKGGAWDRGPYLGSELKDKVLGVVGLGRIGREVARRAQGMEMRVIGSDPFLPATAAADVGVELLPLAALLAQADFVTLHVPRTPETRYLIDRDQIALMKRGSRLINCARGALVRESTLLEALESGHLAGAACDVFETEPTDNARLLAHPAFIGTPHLGGATHEARERVGEGIAHQVADYLSAGIIHHAINVQAVPPEEQRPMRPYLELGRCLGALVSQCFQGIEALRLESYGDITAFTLRPLTASVLAGFFRPFLGEQVNVVNALAVARERGLQVEESKSSSRRGYSSLIRVVARTENGTHSVAGTVFDGERARLVEFESVPIEVTPRGHLLLFANEDIPGVIGHVGTFLANRHINIADMSLGRGAPGSTAIGAITLDQPLDPEGLRELVARADIRWARTLEL